MRNRDQPPATIFECLEDLVGCIEYSRECNNNEELANLFTNIRDSLVAYLKLKEWVIEEINSRHANPYTE